MQLPSMKKHAVHASWAVKRLAILFTVILIWITSLILLQYDAQSGDMEQERHRGNQIFYIFGGAGGTGEGEFVTQTDDATVANDPINGDQKEETSLGVGKGSGKGSEPVAPGRDDETLALDGNNGNITEFSNQGAANESKNDKDFTKGQDSDNGQSETEDDTLEEDYHGEEEEDIPDELPIEQVVEEDTSDDATRDKEVTPDEAPAEEVVVWDEAPTDNETILVPTDTPKEEPGKYHKNIFTIPSCQVKSSRRVQTNSVSAAQKNGWAKWM
jgi:hypothetical protein